MKKSILKRAIALSCLTLALFCVVKKEEVNKKPIIMKQLAAAEQTIDREDSFVNELFEIDESIKEEEMREDELATETTQTIGDDVEGDNIVDDVIENVDGQSVVEYEVDEDLSIMVIGKAHASLSPDTAVIYARIESKECNIDSAKESNLEIFDNVVSVLIEKGLEKNNIKLQHFSCSPCYEFSISRSATCYCSSTSFSVEIPSIENVEEYISILTENGVCCIDNICYTVSNMEEQYNNILSQAVDNARLKAEKISGGQGLTLVQVKEEGVHSVSLYAKTCCDDVSLSDYVGQIEVNATVVAVFEK